LRFSRGMQIGPPIFSPNPAAQSQIGSGIAEAIRVVTVIGKFRLRGPARRSYGRWTIKHAILRAHAAVGIEDLMRQLIAQGIEPTALVLGELAVKEFWIGG